MSLLQFQVGKLSACCLMIPENAFRMVLEEGSCKSPEEKKKIAGSLTFVDNRFMNFTVLYTIAIKCRKMIATRIGIGGY